MNDFIKIIQPYWQYLSIVIGFITTFIGFKIVFSSKFLKSLMSKGRMWEHNEKSLFSEKQARDYNRFRGLSVALVGIMFIILGIAAF